MNCKYLLKIFLLIIALHFAANAETITIKEAADILAYSSRSFGIAKNREMITKLPFPLTLFYDVYNKEKTEISAERFFAMKEMKIHEKRKPHTNIISVTFFRRGL